ncbi:TolB family protein [Prosthecodimorpha staleyi]|uniref:PD40 domain-containing protein n=1 Tax=Prosthecodimorpha staleyi TaxID=2840188 RepID=A0A947D8Q3_9HYPH|nr:hypothetical protein [Prosthecodimorpha staleyi]MBT9288884.1 PD40 domain-containing protein [Prosthecodimorpha staleyi]
MTALPGYAVALLILLNGAALADPIRLAAEDGRIVVIAADGSRRVVSAGPGDRDPVLSPDGRQVAFLRPEGKPDADEDEGQPVALMLVAAEGGPERRLVAPERGAEPKTNLLGINNPAFAADGKSVYFLARAWAVSDAVHRVALAGGRPTFVVDGNSVEAIRSGRLTGDLLVSRHSFSRPAASITQSGSKARAWLARQGGRAP